MMILTDQALLTRRGFEQKQKRLEHCLYLLHDVIPKRLKQAIEHARDLNENCEYRDAEMEKELLEAEVRRLEELLDHAKIIDNHTLNPDQVEIGVQVILKSDLRNDLTVLEVVSPAEVDLEHGRISTQSPLGRHLMGKRKGHKITLTTASRTITYEIVGIQPCGEDCPMFSVGL